MTVADAEVALGTAVDACMSVKVGVACRTFLADAEVALGTSVDAGVCVVNHLINQQPTTPRNQSKERKRDREKERLSSCKGAQLRSHAINSYAVMQLHIQISSLVRDSRKSCSVTIRQWKGSR